jgi:hypothetical protein
MTSSRHSTLDLRRSTLDFRLSHFSFSAFDATFRPQSRGALSGLPSVVVRTPPQELGSAFFLGLVQPSAFSLFSQSIPLPISLSDLLVIRGESTLIRGNS